MDTVLAILLEKVRNFDDTLISYDYSFVNMRTSGRTMTQLWYDVKYVFIHFPIM